MPTNQMTMSTLSTTTMPAPTPAKKFGRARGRRFTEIFTWWLMLAAIAAAALLLHAAPTGAQQTGPLPAATPSDEPPPPPQSTAPKLIGGKPDLSGTWALNKDDSDDPRQAMREAAGNSGGGNGNGGNGGNGGGNGGGGPRIGMGGGGGGMGGGGWGGRGGGGNGGGNRGGQNVENPAGDLSQLTIYQTPTSATVTNDAGRVIAQYTSGSTPQSGPTMKNSTPNATGNSTGSSTPSAGSAPSSSSPAGDSGASNNGNSSDNASTAPNAQWKGSQFVAVTPGRRQGSTTHTFELSPDGKQLYVTTKIDNPRFQSPVTFRLVYDPVQSAE
jgi:hypothetical protein